jgi:[ribosomal protein S18]-alanine N-acetyltransferase
LKDEGIDMQEFSVRLANGQDEDFLWDMLYHSIYVPEGGVLPPKSVLDEPHIKRILSGWGRDGDLALIAEDSNNRPIGAVYIRLFTEENKTYGYYNNQTPILGIAMLPEYRGKGIGTILLEGIFKEAKALGYQHISLSVDPNNPALRLYERFGFEKVGVDGTSWDMVAQV